MEIFIISILPSHSCHQILMLGDIYKTFHERVGNTFAIKCKWLIKCQYLGIVHIRDRDQSIDWTFIQYWTRVIMSIYYVQALS